MADPVEYLVESLKSEKWSCHLHCRKPMGIKNAGGHQKVVHRSCIFLAVLRRVNCHCVDSALEKIIKPLSLQKKILVAKVMLCNNSFLSLLLYFFIKHVL